MTIMEIAQAIASRKATIKTEVANAKASAAKGCKVPVGQVRHEELGRALATESIKAFASIGLVPVNANVSKTGTSATVTWRKPMNLAERTARYEATNARRKAAVAERKAAKAAPATATVPLAQSVAASPEFSIQPILG